MYCGPFVLENIMSRAHKLNYILNKKMRSLCMKKLKADRSKCTGYTSGRGEGTWRRYPDTFMQKLSATGKANVSFNFKHRRPALYVYCILAKCVGLEANIPIRNNRKVKNFFPSTSHL
jgi:hypothetical protein